MDYSKIIVDEPRPLVRRTNFDLGAGCDRERDVFSMRVERETDGG